MIHFGSAGMLWWSFAALIPFLIHLWNRKPREVVPFAATRFLIAATQRQSRRVKLHQRLLLAARVAALLLLAFALAEPRWGSAPAAAPGPLPTHHVLVLDDSYSMAARSGGETRFDEAKGRLLELVREAPVGDLFSLVVMGEPPQVVISGPSREREEVERVLEELMVRPVRARVAPALSLVRRLLEDAPALAAYPHTARVTIATDLARNSFGPLTPQQIDAELSAAAPGVSWTLQVVGEAPPRMNLAIADFRSDAGVAYQGEGVTGVVDVINAGSAPVENHLLELRAGDEVLFREEISLAAGEQTSLPWRIIPSRGPLLLEARLDEDDLTIDNRRYLAMQVRATPRLLCIASSRAAAQHVLLALTSGPPQTRPTVDLLLEGQPPTSLAEYDAVLLLNLPLHDAALQNTPIRGKTSVDTASQSNAETLTFAEALRRYVEQGGGLVIGLGDRAAPDTALRAPLNELVPASIGPLQRVDAPRLDPLDYEHPLLAAFRDAPEVGITSPPIWRYLKLTPQNSAKVAARFGNGDPALMEAAVGRGRVILFAGSLGAESVDLADGSSTPWSGLPGSAAYVPLLLEWTRRAATPEPEPSRQVSEPFPVQLLASEVEFSTGEAWRAWPQSEKRFDLSGFYRTAKEDQSVPIAVNIDAQESLYESERSRFAQWIDQPPPEQPSPIAAKTPTKPGSDSTWLLIPLAALLCAEVALATWLRRRRSHTASLARNGV